MSTNNNSTMDVCNLTQSQSKIKDQVYFFVFYILTPLYFFVAFTGHLLLIIGFVKRAKTDPGYVYQIFLTAAKTTEILMFASFVIIFKWFSGIEVDGSLWFEENYVLMWLAAHAATPLQNSCTTTSLLLAVAMAADRVFALWKPFVYKNINNKKHQIVALVCCVILGWSTSIFDWFRFELQFNGDFYEGVVDSIYVGGPLAKSLSNLRNVLRAVGVLSLIFLNIFIVVLYHRKASGKKKLITQSSISASEEKRISERNKTERTLTTIVIGQSIVITISMGLFVAFYILVYAWPLFSLCSTGILFACVMDAILELGDVVTFLLVACIDKKMKTVILAALTCQKNQVHAIGTAVGTVNGNANGNGNGNEERRGSFNLARHIM